MEIGWSGWPVLYELQPSISLAPTWIPTARDQYNIMDERLCGALYIRIGIGIFPSRPLRAQS